MVSLLTWAVSSLVVTGAPTTTSFEFRNRPKQLQAVAAEDPNTLILVLRPAPGDLAAVLNQDRPLGMAWRAVPLSEHGVEVQLTFAEPIASFTIQPHGTAAIIQVQRHSRLSALRERLMQRLPRSVPVDFASPGLENAETAFRQGRLDDAARRFEALNKEYALEGWVGVRRADILFMRGDLPAACTAYRVVTFEQTVRTVSQLAILRRFAAQCPESKADEAERAALIARLNPYDSAVSRFLWDETLFALQLSNRETDLEEAVGLTERAIAVQVFMSGWAAESAGIALSRLLYRTQEPWERATICQRYRPLIHSTSIAPILLLACGEALLDLELPAAAMQSFEEGLVSTLPPPRRAAWALSEGKQQLLAGLALARSRTPAGLAIADPRFVPSPTADAIEHQEPAASLLAARARLLALTGQTTARGANDN